MCKLTLLFGLVCGESKAVHLTLYSSTDNTTMFHVITCTYMLSS